MRRRLAFLLSAALGTVVPLSSDAAESCDTALGRIAKKVLEKAVSEHQTDACSDLKVGPLGLDVTKKLVLRTFQLCESGPVVKATVVVDVKCATGKKAFISDDVEDDITATASANLDSCQVADVDIQGGKRVVQAGLSLADVSRKLHEAAQKEIKPYCN